MPNETTTNVSLTQIAAVKRDLEARYLDRSDVIQGLILSLLTNQHCLMIGPPGTAKSLLARDLCSRITGSKYFSWLLTRYTLPEELFGPFSLKEFENDKFLRVPTGKAPEAQIWFLDEVFKSGSAIRNTLLTALNERHWYNNGLHPLPLRLCVGASNELPDDDESGAFLDRFLFRFQVEYVSDSSAFELLTRPESSLEEGGAEVTTTWETIDAARRQIANIDLPENDKGANEILSLMIRIRNDLRREGVVISDRRLRQFPKIVKAAAWLEAAETALDTGQAVNVEVHEDHLVYLANAIWESPEQIGTVQKALRGLIIPSLQTVYDARETAREVWKTFVTRQQKGRTSDTNDAIEVRQKIEACRRQVEDAKKGLSRLRHQHEATRVSAEMTELLRLSLNYIVKTGTGAPARR